jgi:hypothetical protein
VRWRGPKDVNAVLLGAIGLLSVGEFLLFGALAEAYRSISQLRAETGMIDTPTPVDMGSNRGRPPSEFGLPNALDDAVRALVLFVDSRCGTCRSIVTSLDGSPPRNVWLVVMDESQEAASQWLSEAGFDVLRLADARVSILPPDDPNPLGVTITPLALQVENGTLVRATTVPSVRRFYGEIPVPFDLTPAKTREKVPA